jgi:hypothetical protein
VEEELGALPEEDLVAEEEVNDAEEDGISPFFRPDVPLDLSDV